MTTARAVGLVRCHACELLNPAPGLCTRCATPVHGRKPDSLNRTWALLIGAAVLYIPANVFPVLTVYRLGVGEADTILSGVVELIAAGMIPIAVLVFFASITVPMLKLVGLTYLLISVGRRQQGRARDRTVLYRIIAAVGRWSMIDMFMLSILVALVQLGDVATIDPGVGAMCFASVVVLTMFAASTFDPRVIWDEQEDAS